MLSKPTIETLARTLDSALLESREIERLTLKQPDLAIEQAYDIQDAGIRLREARGEKVIGLKMGLTSEAKRKQMNLSSPCYGVLTDRMQVADGGAFSLKGKIHPKIEPEIAFRIRRELRGPVTLEQAREACEAAYAALEILDSRYTGFKYFSLPDVVADNSSSAYFVVARQGAPARGLEFGALRMSMSVNGRVAESALSSAISGDALVSVVQLCELLSSRGRALPAGSIVLAGAATAAVKLEPGMEVSLEVEKLGSCSVRVTG